MGKEGRPGLNPTQVPPAGGVVTAEAKQVNEVETGPSGLVTTQRGAGQRTHMASYKLVLYTGAEIWG